MKNNLLLFCALILSTFLSAQNLELVQFATGLNSPVDITNAGDGRLFITERGGKIRILNADGSIEPGEFLDINNLTTPDCSGGCEQGLLGLDFHPDFANNGFFYVNYTAAGGGDTHISRFTVSAGNPNVADPDSEVILMDISQPFGNHNGGGIKFGPDGYLYIGMGDGGAGGDPQAYSQNRQSLLGKMLRIDVDNGTPYSIPADNPFVNDDETLDEIWSIGVRNPWRFSFDRETGDMWIADVGQNAWEEVDFEPAGSPGGVNYGWRCREGQTNFNTSNCPPTSELTDPVHVYATSSGFGQGCSITGGFVYRGCDYPEFYGKYIYGDYCSSRIWALTNNGDGTFSNQELLNYDNFEISSFGEDVNGEIYMAAISEGRIYRVTETSNPAPTIFFTISNVSCPNEADGSIDLTLTGNNTYIWSNGAVTEDITGLLAGQYTVTVTTEAGCEKIQTFDLEEPNLPTITIENDNGTLNVTGTTNDVNWVLEGEVVATGTTFTPSQSGDYTAIFTNAEGCEISSNSVSVMVSSIEDLEVVENLFIAPNPFTDAIQVEFNSSEKSNFILRILNVDGKEMHREKFTVDGVTTRSLSLPNLTSGIYFLHLGNEQGEFVQKLVKE
jgi:glucose/arabinose dehydrogenase